MHRQILRICAVAALLGSALAPAARAADPTLLNVSYDPTRELYQDYNTHFASYWKGKTGGGVTVNQSHGGSGAQARAVIDGLEADVVTLGVPPDVDAIAKAGLLAKDWRGKFPNNSAPYTSTVVFLVRKGNPKHIKDWDDLVKPDTAVITPNPKTSGIARLNYLAAWGYALKASNNDEVKARAFVTALYKNVPVLDSGGRGATLTFVERGIGDVLLAWENEALLAVNQLGQGDYEIVTPSLSILAEPSVAVVDSVVDRHNTRKIAEAYLQELYSPAGQAIVAKHYYRPRDETALKAAGTAFPAVTLFSVDSLGGWDAVQQRHFADGGVFDQLIGDTKR
jgi:sulfate transport system substrate-binding protein